MSSTDRAATSRIRPRTRGALTAVVAVAVAGATMTAVSPALGDPVTGMTGLVPLPTGATAFLAAASESGSTIAVSFGIDNSESGRRESYVKVKSGGSWGPDVLVSDPTRNAYDVSIDVDSDGSVLVAWEEDVPDTSVDQIVVRRVSSGAAGARQVIASSPYSSLDVSGGANNDLVAWEPSDGSPLYAAVDSGSGFSAPAVVAETPGSMNVVDGSVDVTADGGRLHATFLASDANYDFYEAWWATYDPSTEDAWTPMQLNSWRQTMYYEAPRIAADAGGNAMVHALDGGNDAPTSTAHVFNASGDIIAPDVTDRMSLDGIDLGSLTGREAVNRGGLLLALLGNSPPTYATLTPASNGGSSASFDSATAAECNGQSWVLGVGLDFFCDRDTGTGAEIWTGTGTLVGTLAPSSGATDVTAAPIHKAVPVFVVREYRSGNDPQWLLDPSGDGSGPTSTPTTTAPTTAAPTTAPPTSTPPPPVATPTVTAPAPTAPAPTATSSPSATLLEFVKLTRPRIKGKLVVGERLRARPGTWSPEPGTVRYRWFADGEKIRKATKARLYLKPALRGMRIKVRIRLIKSGFETEIRYVKRKGRVQAG